MPIIFLKCSKLLDIYKIPLLKNIFDTIYWGCGNKKFLKCFLKSYFLWKKALKFHQLAKELIKELNEKS